MKFMLMMRKWLYPVPNAVVGKKYLANKFGQTRTDELYASVKTRYWRMLERELLPSNPILRWHEVNYLLPGLALYQVLLEEYSGDTAAAMADVEEVVRLTILKQTRLPFAPLKWPRDPFPLFRWGFRLVMLAFPAKGWTFDYLENSPQRVDFNVTHCFYFEVLTRLGFPGITRVFCRADDAMAENFPPGVCYARSTTIGKGSEYCDFRYWRNKT